MHHLLQENIEMSQKPSTNFLPKRSCSSEIALNDSSKLVTNLVTLTRSTPKPKKKWMSQLLFWKQSQRNHHLNTIIE